MFRVGDFASPGVRLWPGCSADGADDARADGYAVVDAMTAMLILALTVTLSLQAVGVGLDAARRTGELRGAEALLRALMIDGPRQFGAVEGRSGDFAWRLETQPTGAERPIELCRRAAAVASTRSLRRYAAVSLESCPPAQPS